MTKRSLNIGVIGCGMISDWYFRAAKRFSQMNMAACADLKEELAVKQGETYNIPVKTVDEIFADPSIDLVLNLTPPKAHYAIAKRTLESGKHAYSEKPLGIDLAEARELLALAESKGLAIGCAPDTFLGGGPQTMRKLLDDGWIGKPVAGTVICLGRGPEKWIHAPAFYDVGAGPMLDIGPYFITQLINLLGPAVAVTACVTKGADSRIGGADTVPQVYPVNVPTHQSGIIEFACGTQITMINSYEVFGPQKHPFMELYGTRGSLAMHHPNFFGGEVKLYQIGYEDWRDVPPAFIYNTDARSLGVVDMIEAILDKRPARASGKLACHALEIMLAFEKSAKAGKRIELETTCDRPAAMLPAVEDGEIC
ncbi:MAG: Gfo/Idh/MocA family oxidoreductase [Lentisphaeria bacterium]|nr:Gfo/Idh/MocA family oxidoreductase [Lentisphaeria bacterium]